MCNYSNMICIDLLFIEDDYDDWQLAVARPNAVRNQGLKDPCGARKGSRAQLLMMNSSVEPFNKLMISSRRVSWRSEISQTMLNSASIARKKNLWNGKLCRPEKRRRRAGIVSCDVGISQRKTFVPANLQGSCLCLQLYWLYLHVNSLHACAGWENGHTCKNDTHTVSLLAYTSHFFMGNFFRCVMTPSTYIFLMIFDPGADVQSWAVRFGSVLGSIAAYLRSFSFACLPGDQRWLL